MKFYESGDSSKPVIFLFPGTCCLYSSFDHILDGLHSYFYTVTVSYDGFDPNEKTEFYSMEDECEKIEQEIKKKYGGRIKAAYGCSLGGSFVSLLIQRKRIHIDHGIIGSSDMDEAGRLVAKIKSSMVSMTGTFIDTIVICTMTGLSIVITGTWNTGLEGVEITTAAFQKGLPFPPVVASFALMICLVFFAFTTLLGNCFYCDNLLIYIHKKQPEKAFMKGFRLVSALAIFLGAGMEMSLLWDLSDVLMGVMALINIPVILILSGTAFKAIRDYEDQLKRGVNPVFKSADIELEQKTDFWN